MPKSDPRRPAAQEDPGLFSLSQIMHLMRVEFSRAQRYNYPIACVLIAVDRLGELRELYGYDSKEAILDESVKLLQSMTRSCDFLGRLGDDKLLAILPHTSTEGLRTMAERVLRGMRELNFESDGRQLQITASIGGSHNSGGTTMFFDTLLAAAEGALAEAAAGGGDRFCHRDPGTVGG